MRLDIVTAQVRHYIEKQNKKRVASYWKHKEGNITDPLWFGCTLGMYLQYGAYGVDSVTVNVVK